MFVKIIKTHNPYDLYGNMFEATMVFLSIGFLSYKSLHWFPSEGGEIYIALYSISFFPHQDLPGRKNYD